MSETATPTCRTPVDTATDHRPQRLCLRCDNRHGCRTPEPECLTLPRAPDERALSGRSLMERRGRLDRCRTCGLFRQCWTAEAYRRALAAPFR